MMYNNKHVTFKVLPTVTMKTTIYCVLERRPVARS